MTDRSGRTMRERGDSASVRLNAAELYEISLLLNAVREEAMEDSPDDVVLAACRDALNHIQRTLFPRSNWLILPEEEYDPPCDKCGLTSYDHPEIQEVDANGNDYSIQVCPNDARLLIPPLVKP